MTVDPMDLICAWCGLKHGPVKCALVKAMEFDKNGRLRRIEFVCDSPAQEVVIRSNGQIPVDKIPDIITFDIKER